MNAVIEKPKLLSVMATRLGVEPENMLRILKNTCIKPTRGGKEATNEEVQAFLIVANRYDLNPLTREIYAFENNGAIIPIVSIDGWATLVNRNEHFDGCDFEIEHSLDGSLVSITCRIYDKRRNRPVSVTEYLAECQRPSQPWRTMPHRMLRHKAFMQAARLAFGLSGIYDEDEGLQIARSEMQSIGDEPHQQTKQAVKPKASGVDRLKAKLLPVESKPVETLQPEASELVDSDRIMAELRTAKTRQQVLEIGKRLCENYADATDMISEYTEIVLADLEAS